MTGLLGKAVRETRLRFFIAAIALGAATVFGTDDAVKTLFVFFAILLGGGTLAQERALGTLAFTLALPVGRSRHAAVRAAVGIAEVALLSGVVATRLPLGRAVACGFLLFALGFLVASLVASDAVAWLVGFLLVLGYEGAVYAASKPGLSLLALLGGDGPLLALPVVVLAGVALLAVAASRRQEP